MIDSAGFNKGTTEISSNVHAENNDDLINIDLNVNATDATAEFRNEFNAANESEGEEDFSGFDATDCATSLAILNNYSRS